MKNLGFASILVLSLTLPQLATAQSASGSYRVILDRDGLIKSVDFAADERGGSMSFSDEAKILDGEDIEDPRHGDPTPVFLKADLDLTVEKNRALMSGMVYDSSHKSLIGSLVQLVVEDNAESRVPDQLTWVFCTPRDRGWVPSDAELKQDDGA